MSFSVTDVEDLERQLLGRTSILPSRRRRAYAACLALIKFREIVLERWRVLDQIDDFPELVSIGRGTMVVDRVDVQRTWQ